MGWKMPPSYKRWSFGLNYLRGMAFETHFMCIYLSRKGSFMTQILSYLTVVFETSNLPNFIREHTPFFFMLKDLRQLFSLYKLIVFYLKCSYFSCCSCYNLTSVLWVGNSVVRHKRSNQQNRTDNNRYAQNNCSNESDCRKPYP